MTTNPALKKPSKWAVIAATFLILVSGLCGTAQARYLEPDPLGLLGPTTPDSNPYVYAKASPQNYTDPSGLCPNGDVMCDIAMRNAGLPQFADSSEPLQQTRFNPLVLLPLLLPGVDLAALVEEGAATTAAAEGPTAGEMCGVGQIPQAVAIEQEARATGFLGNNGFELGNPKYLPARNLPGEVNGQTYRGHAFDQMQNRGILPSVVQNTIQNGTTFPTRSGTAGYYDPINNVRVIVNPSTGDVVTVIRGAP